MNCKKIFKRIGIFFLCFLLLFFAVFSSYPKTIKAVVPVVAIGAAAIAAFFSAAGISLTATNIANNSTMSDTLNDFANQYSSETGSPTIEEEMEARNALNYYYNEQAGDAIVSFGDSMSQWLNGFKNWFVQNFALTDSGESIIVNDSFIHCDSGNYIYYQDRSIFVNGNTPLSIFPISAGTYTIDFNSNLSFNVIISEPYQYYGTRIRIDFQELNGNGTVIGSFYQTYLADQSGSFDYVRIFFSQNGGALWLNMAPSSAGDYTVWNYGIATNISVNSLNIESIGLSGSLTDGYDDFEQALSDARSDAGANGQVAVNVGDVAVERPYTEEGIAEGILNNTIANTGEGVLVGGYADEKEVEEETDSEKVPSYAEIGKNIVIVDGLEDFFPFCIPFDLYEIVRLLNVSPEAPKFNWKMNFGDTGINDYDIEIDLTPYETVAVIFRTLIIIGFLVFLTIKTRDLIRG